MSHVLRVQSYSIAHTGLHSTVVTHVWLKGSFIEKLRISQNLRVSVSRRRNHRASAF
jgi:hypothetical protein